MKKTLLLGLAALALSTGMKATILHDWSDAVGSTSFDHGGCISNVAGGYVVSAGNFIGTVDFDPGVGSISLTASTTAMYIMQTATGGSPVWAVKTSGTGYAEPLHIIQDASGKIYVCGRFKGTVNFDPAGSAAGSQTSAGGDDAFLASYSNTGGFNWVIRWGSTQTDEAYSVTFNPAGNLMVCGDFTGTVNFNPAGTANKTSAGGTDGFIARYSTAGAYGTVSQIGGTGDDCATGIGVDYVSSTIFVSGHFHGTANFNIAGGSTTLTSAGGSDIFVVKYATGGTISWLQGAGGTNDDFSWGLVVTNNGVYICGAAGPGTDNFGIHSMTVSGTTSDGYATEYDIATGNNSFLAQFSGAGDDKAQSITSDNNAYIYVTGVFYNTVTFSDPSGLGSPINISNAGASDAFIVRYNTGGVLKDAVSIAGTGSDDCPGVSAYSNSATSTYQCFVTGGYGSTAEFNPSGTSVTHTSAGSTDIFTARYSWTSPLRMHAQEETATINLFPNPSAGAVTVDHLVAGDVVTLYSIDGKEAASWVAEEDRLSLDLSAFENGVYLLNIRKTDGSVVSEKILLQR